jgi:group I intron endonuclease
MGYIYMLKNKKNGKVYIGQTIRTIEKRLEEHRKGQSNRCRAIYNAIKLHGWENFEKDWYVCPNEDLNFDEELLVREMETLAPKGYNLREGGGNRGKHSEESKQKNREAHIGKTHHEETKKIMSETRLGRIHTDEAKQKIGEAHIGKTLSKETKQKIKEAKLGKTLSDETKQKISEIHLGVPKSREHKQKLSESKKGDNNHKSKRVYQYDIEGNFIGSFGSCGEAARHIEKHKSSISKCASEKQETAYGFKWSYSANVIQNV